MYNVKNIQDDIFVIKNIIPQEYQKSILEKIKGDNSFPWYTIDKIGHNQYSTDNKSPYKDKNVSDFGGLYHMLYDEGIKRSEDLDFFAPILKNYCDIFDKHIQTIFRIRMRYTHPIPGHNNTKYAAPHVDFNDDIDFKTLIYYVDDSDGDTILFSKFHKPGIDEYDPFLDEELTVVYKHTPKKGEAIVFNGNRYHAGNYPITYGKRIVINFDFVEKNES